MRSILALSAAFLFSSTAYAQIETADMGDEFKEISKFGTRQTGFEGIQTYSSGVVNGSQFFYPTWSAGTVTTIKDEKVGKNYVFLFDKVRQELFMKWKDSSVILLADKNQVSSFTLNTDKTHFFVAAAKYNPSAKGNFFEVLVDNENGYTLLKQVKTMFVKADERDIEKQRLGDIYDSFQDQVTYYITFHHGPMQPIAVRKTNILKVLAPVKDKVQSYFSQHSESTVDETLLQGVIESLNS